MEWGGAARDTTPLAILAPLALGLVGALAMVAPFRFFEGVAPTPLIPLMVVYFWTLYEPTAAPAASVFAIGWGQDLITGAPHGLWALTYLLVYGAVLSQRQFLVGRSFAATWTGFIAAAVLGGAIAWLGVSIVSGARVAGGDLALQLGVSALVYPVFARGFAYLQTRLAEDAR
ncbi:MAG: rod shape-determining protein MreD [Pseudomonadota bacterium]